MNKDQAKRAIGLICERFNVPVPALNWTDRAKNGRAWLDKIMIGPRCWRGVEAVLIHEITHVICFRQVGNHAHGPKFWLMLESVTKVWYGDSTLYPWHNEYKAGKSYAGRRKFVSKN